jgi:hypothetical protein
MAGQRSRQELVKFLNYVSSKGLLSPATVESRKASVNKVLGILSEDEADDVAKLNLDEVVRRFANLHGQQYTADSLRTYKSRTKSSIDDFLRYVENPMAFKIGGPKRQPKEKPSNGAAESKTSGGSVSPVAGVPASPPPSAGTGIVPIAIRSDVIVHVQGLPFDLTAREAKKIANVILAMAMDEE